MYLLKNVLDERLILSYFYKTYFSKLQMIKYIWKNVFEQKKSNVLPNVMIFRVIQ